MKSRWMELIIFVLIVVYALIIIVSLSFNEQLEGVQTELLLFEIVLLTLFLMEIGLKIYAFQLNYIGDGWNIFDCIVVLGCFVITAI